MAKGAGKARKKLPKELAVVRADNCTGCEACIEVCPVDCIYKVPGEDLPSRAVVRGHRPGAVHRLRPVRTLVPVGRHRHGALGRDRRRTSPTRAARRSTWRRTTSAWWPSPRGWPTSPPSSRPRRSPRQSSRQQHSPVGSSNLPGGRCACLLPPARCCCRLDSGMIHAPSHAGRLADLWRSLPPSAASTSNRTSAMWSATAASASVPV